MTYNSGSGQSNQFYFAIHVNGVEQTAPQKDGNGNYDLKKNGFVQLVKTFSQGDYIDLRGQVSTGTELLTISSMVPWPLDKGWNYSSIMTQQYILKLKNIWEELQIGMMKF